MHARFGNSRRHGHGFASRLRILALAVLATGGLVGCLQYTQPAPDVMIVQGAPTGTVHMRIPYHVGAGVPMNGFLGGYPLHNFGFWYDPFSPRPWGLSPYAGAFTSLYYPWYGWSPIGWRGNDPVIACMHGGRRGPNVCRPGWLVPAHNGPQLVADEPAAPVRSPLAPNRPTYGGLSPTAEISQVDLWQIWQRDRFGAGRRAGDRDLAAGDSYEGPSRQYGASRSAASQAAAGGVRSAGTSKGGPSRTQPISRSYRPDVNRSSPAPRAYRSAPSSRSGSNRSPVRSVDSISSRSAPSGRSYPSQNER